MGRLSGFPKDGQYADHTAAGPDREGQRAVDVGGQRLGIAPPNPAVMTGATVDPRPVFTTRLTSNGPDPSPSALPTASNATSSGDPSEDE